ncbi:hypothetical protein ACO0LL_05620 [Undibacterium sp. TC4M20W]|uniref:hypothetical protein n=1 Tax=Undibacterium sp. TC4M20W TaxID=3413052 RepID=UPI003BF1B1C0
MDVLKLAVLGGIGWYVYTHYLVKKSIAAPAADRPTVDMLDKLRQAVTDPIKTGSQYQGFAVGEPMYQPKLISSDADVPWSDRAKFIM